MVEVAMSLGKETTFIVNGIVILMVVVVVVVVVVKDRDESAIELRSAPPHFFMIELLSHFFFPSHEERTN